MALHGFSNLKGLRLMLRRVCTSACPETPLASYQQSQCRLLRNRVSAQQARERKKLYVSELESKLQEKDDQITQLKNDVRRAAATNATLRRLIQTMKSGSATPVPPAETPLTTPQPTPGSSTSQQGGSVSVSSQAAGASAGSGPPQRWPAHSTAPSMPACLMTSPRTSAGVQGVQGAGVPVAAGPQGAMPFPAAGGYPAPAHMLGGAMPGYGAMGNHPSGMLRVMPMGGIPCSTPILPAAVNGWPIQPGAPRPAGSQ